MVFGIKRTGMGSMMLAFTNQNRITNKSCKLLDKMGFSAFDCIFEYRLSPSSGGVVGRIL
jgi:hypothetical protein